MAVRSTTASTATLPPRAIHAGMNVATGSYLLDAAASTTVSDVILMCRVPDRAIIVDGFLKGHSGPTASGNTFKIGTTQDDDALHASISLNATQTRNDLQGDLPFQVSLSDDVEPKWTWVKVTRIAGSSTLTESLRLVVKYVMPGNI
jgi:hypothetical protein